MSKLTRGLLILGLLWLEVVLFYYVGKIRDSENPDNTTLLLLFLGIVVIAIVIGTIFALFVVPAIGEFVGNFFFNPNQEIEKSPHSAAMAKIAQGDYEGAVEEYKKTLEETPDDTHALSEIIHLYCDKLHNHDAAELFMEDALQKEWPPEQGAFLASRLVDIYWIHKHDAARARHVLNQIVDTMPDTKYAANAAHRLHEIDRALADEEAGIRPPATASTAPELPPDEIKAES
jgi:tetratricopeptide (TPR) repeat protein